MSSHIDEFLKSWGEFDTGTFGKRGLVLMLEEYNKLIKLEELVHYYDTTVGMFATDRPDLVDDSMHRVLIELEEIKETK